MDPITQQQALAAAGAAGGDPLYVDDVFSTYLYDGTGAAKTITNGIDLDGEGGLVWFKQRSTTYSHALIDTVRGGTKWLRSNSNEVEATDSAAITSFNSNGFTLGTSDQINNNTQDHVSWTFRKAPGFFDVVTYNGPTSGNTPQDIPHNLGVVPAVIIVKSTSNAYPWYVYHKDLGADKYLQLETDDSVSTDVNIWDNTTPTATTFRVGNNNAVNTNNGTHVAYLFAHDDASFGTAGDEAIIKCGSYTGNSSSQSIDVGFEPQWLLIKNTTTGTTNWQMLDTMRGLANSSSDQPRLEANATSVESNAYRFNVTSNGFFTDQANDIINQSGQTYIYMAIRRPNKPPEAGTDVFAIDTGNSSSTIPTFDSGFPVDAALRRANYTSGASNPRFTARLTGTKEMYTSMTNQEASDIYHVWDSMSGYATYFDSDDIAYMFRRAPGFMDVVAYTGTGSAQNIPHNLGVKPELIITKARNASSSWAVQAGPLGATDRLRLNTDDSTSSISNYWNDTEPTSTVFTVGPDTNTGASNNYIAYLFATLPGISKVGSYNGTGNNIDVDCGFSSGARFVLIKRTDSTGHWYVWDTTRGIVSGNDPFFLLNNTNVQTTTEDYIDPLNSGFTVTSNAGTDINASGGTYLFLAIA